MFQGWFHGESMHAYRICLQKCAKRKNANAHLDVQMSIHVFACCAFLPTDSIILHRFTMKPPLKSRFGIVIESAEPREPHHFSCLFGYGASAINPYMVNEIIADQVQLENIKGIDADNAIQNFNKAIATGIVKVMNKIGRQTIYGKRCLQVARARATSIRS